MPSNAQYALSASGSLLLPIKNGYANRLIRDQVGAGSITLPSWAKTAKVALIGAAGSGATARNNGGIETLASAGGGGPLVLAWLDLEAVGRSFNFVLGAGGASVTTTGTAGNPGAVSSVVWGSRTLTANPGQGGLIGATENAVTLLAGGAGGLGTGGDINNQGGAGGPFCARSVVGQSCYPGGGSSGRPQGPGNTGGYFDGVYPNGNATFACPGASWGFTPKFAPGRFPASQSNIGGPGCLSVSDGSLPGNGSGSFVSPPLSGTPNGTPILMATPKDNWWDLDDICGWGGGTIPYTTPSVMLVAGPGGGGMGRTTAQNSDPFIPTQNGGFGGGGGGFHTTASSTPIAYAGDGGVGGGGGAASAYYWSPAVYRSGKGGDAWLGVWFN